MKALINLIALSALAAAGARADLLISLDSPSQTGSPGQTLQFFGTITNAGSDIRPVYLNGDNFNFAMNNTSYTLIDRFFDTVPLLLNAGESSPDIDLFDLTLSIPLGDPFGIYLGEYGLTGGMDGGSGSGQDNLIQAGFSVAVIPSNVPEPTTFMMLGLGFALICAGLRDRVSDP